MSLVKGRPGDLFTSFTELGHFVSVYFVSSESMITKFFESFDNLMILKQFMIPNNLPILADQPILADYLYSMNHLISVMIGLHWQV
jgi:Na+-transporting NADH:ubiquinone oxidoreductase subunit NqrD